MKESEAAFTGQRSSWAFLSGAAFRQSEPTTTKHKTTTEEATAKQNTKPTKQRKATARSHVASPVLLALVAAGGIVLNTVGTRRREKNVSRVAAERD